MAERNTKTPEQIEEELNAGNFVKDQLITTGLVLGGGAAGYAVGAGVAKTSLTEKIADKFFGNNELIEEVGKDTKEVLHNLKYSKGIVQGVSIAIGLLVGSMAAQYGHWKKVRRQQFGVEEINKDVANIVDSRVKFEETLDTQAEFIKRLVVEREPKNEHHSHAEAEHHRQQNKSQAVEGLGA